MKVKLEKPSMDPALAKRIREIEAPYKSCQKKLGFKGSYNDLSWEKKTKIRACVRAKKKAK